MLYPLSYEGGGGKTSRRCSSEEHEEIEEVAEGPHR